MAVYILQLLFFYVTEKQINKQSEIWAKSSGWEDTAVRLWARGNGMMPLNEKISV